MTVIARDRAGPFAEGARQGAPDAVTGDERLYHPQPDVITGPLGKHASVHHARGRAHAARQIAQAQAQAAGVELRRHRAP